MNSSTVTDPSSDSILNQPAFRIELAAIILCLIAVGANGWILLTALVAKVRKTYFARTERILLTLTLVEFNWMISVVFFSFIDTDDGSTISFLLNKLRAAIQTICLCLVFLCNIFLAMQRLFLVQRQTDDETSIWFVFAAAALAVPTISLVSLVAAAPLGSNQTISVIFGVVLFATTVGVGVGVAVMYARTFRVSMNLLQNCLAAADAQVYSATRNHSARNVVIQGNLTDLRADTQIKQAHQALARLRIEHALLRNCTIMCAAILVSYAPLAVQQAIAPWWMGSVGDQYWLAAIAKLFVSMDGAVTPLSVLYFNREIRYVAMLKAIHE
ncbi:hypothetical protein BC830DRAFT_812470 [Chytriomyces sp. MP71]|nr:hypothetical protein BC830DRAFT_812470 [Chytriomyces sp. MP71]